MSARTSPPTGTPSPGAVGDARRETAPAPAAAKTVARRRWRRSRLWVGLLLLALAAGAFYAATATGEDRTPLGPRNAAPDGAMAVAQVLGHNGVQVSPVPTLDAALAALEEADGGATLLLDDRDAILDADQLGRLADASGRTVLIQPGQAQLKPFTDRILPAGVVPDAAAPAAAGCDLPVAAQAPRAAANGLMYRADTGCYGQETAAGTAYGYALDGTTTVLGSTEFLDNAHVLDHGHPALALWTLGAEPTLVWYRPGYSDLAVAEAPANPFELLPDWVGPATGWLFVAATAAMLWRGRRPGPLVEEPLPVVVPAAETAEGRARLYQDGRAVGAAVESLRSAALTRIATRLRLGPAATAEDIAATLETAGYRPGPALRRLLFPAHVRTEADLVAWAQDLHTLEKEIGIP